jgi:hypothetical protein
VAVAFAIVAVAAVAVPAGLTWYRASSGPQQFWDPTAFQQAREANLYVARVPPGRPVIFVVSPLGPFGPISTPEKERIIRAAISPARQTDVFVYPGSYANLIAGKPTLEPNAAINRENRPYWRETLAHVRPSSPVIALEELRAPGGRPAEGIALAPGVRLLRGSPVPLRRVRPLHPVPASEVALERAVLLGFLLFAAGFGWTTWFAGPDAPPITLVALSPAVGTGMLMIAGLIASKAGFALGGTGGIVTFAVAATAGLALAAGSVLRMRQRIE